MSGILECDGVFQVPLADGWSVTGQPGRAYDLSHATEDVGVNISVYPRSAVGDDIEEAARNFAAGVGADTANLEVVRPSTVKDHTRAFVRFDNDGRDWLVAFVFLADRAVLVTSNAASGNAQAFAIGEQVVASLGPVPKRGLFRRK